jgi:hypothetical protein
MLAPAVLTLSNTGAQLNPFEIQSLIAATGAVHLRLRSRFTCSAGLLPVATAEVREMLDRLLKNLQGWGKIYDGDIEIALVAYALNIFQEYTSSESVAGREPIRAGKRIEGTITQISGGYIPTGKDLRLTMEGGLTL